MAVMAYMKTLPEGEGPGLQLFEHDILSDDFQYLEVLDRDTSHGLIIKATTGRRLYAIKLFITHEAPEVDYDQCYSVNEETAWDCCDAFERHFTPFEKECRAFGRLQDVGCEHLAVRAHGYVSATSTQVKVKFGSIQARTQFHDLVQHNIQEPMMGIVKDWVDMAPHEDEDLRQVHDRLYQVFHIPQMIENLNELHKNGIVVRDIRGEQYVNGVLVDLSCSKTAPHPYGPTLSGEPSKYQPRWTFASLAAWDLYQFQHSIICGWNKRVEYWVKLLGRPQGLPVHCPFEAYPVPYSCEEARAKHERPYGPFLPLLTLFEQTPFLVKPARWDPLEWEANVDEDKRVKIRKITGKIKEGFVEEVVEGLEKLSSDVS
ncbi:kinetochore Sim4 complex subunit FTA2-domain-containing protein [Fusarium flagelliforme]|uniref:Uncharacterized protein n=1 Tax=Fusarium flagelliforme TaxID=2675880 RepID=A0A395N5C9_9HYPO|nr:kinetochore Sim4 complex subunit FTA2-domain-containing protein [Fusarium flagelliforme]KAH7197875.1 kinetochore Sim4 complex subunit FTA2-domain-containing protein [Fusarium flagelliforme]RFN55326.1 hypothetical protein FIE12Z_362 [Fusarium flagelliforme]